MDEVAGIYARESALLDRYVQCGIAQERVISVSFPEAPTHGASSEHDLLDRIDAYLEGATDDFADVTVALTVSTTEREVLEVVRDIPYGEERTVEQITQMTPDLDAEETDERTAVREALLENPTPLLIPDHRVRDGPSAAPAAVEQQLRTIEGL
jgi:methylated-DNA-[protein]-cysteine S-methyltransferase